MIEQATAFLAMHWPSFLFVAVLVLTAWCSWGEFRE